MNEEEVRENVKKQLEGIKKANECGLATRGEFNKDIEALETVLNLLEKKDRQLEERANRIRNLEKECQKYFDNMMDTIQDNCKKDKIIDEMAEDIDSYQIECNRYFKDKEEVKQYFERKVENG